MTRTLAPLAFAFLVACGGDGGTEDCTEGEYYCSGNVLQQCTDGAFADIEDCDAAGGECMADMGHCHMDTTMEDTAMGTM